MNTNIEELRTSLRDFIARRVSTQEDADDLTQEVLLRWSGFRDQVFDNLKSWLFSVAKNVITDHYRRQGLENDVKYSGDLSYEYNGGSLKVEDSNMDLIDLDELNGCVQLFFNELSPKDQYLIEAVDVEVRR